MTELFLKIFFLIACVPDQYEAQKLCGKAVDDCQAALKFVPGWFVTKKLIKKFSIALYADNIILYLNDNSGNAVFSCNGMGILKTL